MFVLCEYEKNTFIFAAAILKVKKEGISIQGRFLLIKCNGFDAKLSPTIQSEQILDTK